MNRSNPWQAFAESHRQEERIRAPVTRTTDFGIFVALEGGIEGLVHMGDLSSSEPGEVAIRRFGEGSVIDALILSIDVERERVSLGVKQVPYQEFAQRYTAGDRIAGRVREIEGKRLVVEVAGGLSGVVRLGRSRLRNTSFAVGDELDLVIDEVSPHLALIELRLNDDGDDALPVSVQPNRPPSPKPLTTSRER